jgi:hypothetical protein
MSSWNPSSDTHCKVVCTFYRVSDLCGVVIKEKPDKCLINAANKIKNKSNDKYWSL